MLRAMQLELRMNAPHQLVIMGVSVLAAAVTIALAGSMESAMALALIATTSNLYISQIEGDELPGWEAFRALWPLTRQQMVIARYLELLAAVILTLLASTAGCLAVQAACQASPISPLDLELPYDLGIDVGPGILMFNAMALCALEMAVLLPVAFRFSSQTAMTVISVASAALGVFFINLVGYLSELYIEVFGATYWVMSTGTVVAVALAISAMVSIGLYAARDL